MTQSPTLGTLSIKNVHVTLPPLMYRTNVSPAAHVNAVWALLTRIASKDILLSLFACGVGTSTSQSSSSYTTSWTSTFSFFTPYLLCVSHASYQLIRINLESYFPAALRQKVRENSKQYMRALPWSLLNPFLSLRWNGSHCHLVDGKAMGASLVHRSHSVPVASLGFSVLFSPASVWVFCLSSLLPPPAPHRAFWFFHPCVYCLGWSRHFRFGLLRTGFCFYYVRVHRSCFEPYFLYSLIGF